MEGKERLLKIGEVAASARVSVRTLHHYDRVGLVTPSARTDSGYRLYTAADLDRLQTVLFYRELDVPLERIRTILADPGFDRRRALLEQREQIRLRALRLERLLALLDKTIDSLEGGAAVPKDEMFDALGDFDPAEYEQEAKDRWGGTDAYAESARRTSQYTKEDWKCYKAEAEHATLALAVLMDEGVPASDPRATDAAEQARLLIDRWFYPCSRRMHAELGKMYVADPRFAANYEKVRPGLSQYVCDAIQANSERAD